MTQGKIDKQLTTVNSELIFQLADTCVKCGLCLPHCPTYQKTAHEADSPRGRVALTQGLITQAIPDTKRLVESIDRCLECHACEVACPSGTPVTRIVDAVRALRSDRQFVLTRKLRKLLLDLLIHPAPFMPWVRFYQTSALRRWLHKIAILQYVGLNHADALLPERLLLPLPPIQRQIKSLENSARKIKIALFPGCLGRFVDAPALQAATTILTHLGYAVTIPEPASCCGALYRHAGFTAAADLELSQSIQIFNRYDQVLTLASACCSELQQASELVTRLDDATRFIAAAPWPTTLNLDATPQTIWVHVPCTQRHPIGDPNAAINLLERIPGITVLPLPQNAACCGAAGTYMLRQPKLSQALLADKLQIIQSNAVQTLVTTNTGCALHLAAGLRPYGIRVCHPLEILAERLNC